MKCPLCNYRPRPVRDWKDKLPVEYFRLQVHHTVLHVERRHAAVVSLGDWNRAYHCLVCCMAFHTAMDLWGHWEANGGLLQHVLVGRLG